MAVLDKVIYLIWLFYYSRHMPYLQRAGIDPQDKNASRDKKYKKRSAHKMLQSGCYKV